MYLYRYFLEKIGFLRIDTCIDMYKAHRLKRLKIEISDPYRYQQYRKLASRYFVVINISTHNVSCNMIYQDFFFVSLIPSLSTVYITSLL